MTGYFGLWTVCKDLPQGRSFCGQNVTAFRLPSMQMRFKSLPSPPLHTNVTHLENSLNVSVSICPNSMEFHRWRDRRGGRGVAGRGFSGGRVPPVDAKEPRACLFAVPTVGGHAPRSLYSLR